MTCMVSVESLPDTVRLNSVLRALKPKDRSRRTWANLVGQAAEMTVSSAVTQRLSDTTKITAVGSNKDFGWSNEEGYSKITSTGICEMVGERVRSANIHVMYF